MQSDLLRCNDAFYAAIRDGNYRVMDGLWSRQRRVTCTHPGWTLLAGRDAVMDSWRMILTEQSPPQLWPTDPVPIITGGTAMVLCSELLGTTSLIACNAFVLEGSDWRLINHQALPIPLEKAR